MIIIQGKNNFAKVFKNLDRYKNNFVSTNSTR